MVHTINNMSNNRRGQLRKKLFPGLVVLLVSAATIGIVSLLGPSYPVDTGDWMLRARELRVLKTGTDPFDIFSRRLSSPDYISLLDATAPGDPAVHNYAPWTYGFCFPAAFINEEQALQKTAIAWNSVGLLFLVGLIFFLCRERTGRTDLSWALTFIAILLDIFPIFRTFTVGNFSIITAAAAFGLVLLLERKHDYLAGCMLALLMLKIQIGFVFLFPLLTGCRWRTLISGGILCFAFACIPAYYTGKNPITLAWQLLYSGDASFFSLYTGGFFSFLARNISPCMLQIGNAVVALGILLFVSWHLRHEKDWLLKLVPAAAVVPLWTYSQTIDLCMWLLPLIYFLVRLTTEKKHQWNNLFTVAAFSVGLVHALWNIIVLQERFFLADGLGWILVGGIALARFCILGELCLLACSSKYLSIQIPFLRKHPN